MRSGKSGWYHIKVRAQSTVDRWTSTHVSDIVTSKGNQAALRVGGLRGSLRGIPPSSDVRLVSPYLPKEIVRIFPIGVTVFDSGDDRFDGVQISEVGESFFGLRDEEGEGWFRVFHPHSLPGIPGGDTESDPIFADGIGDGLDDFEWESGTVLDGPAVFVCSLVGNVLEELVREVSVGEVELDSVEPGLVNGLIGGIGVPLDVGFDLFNCQRARGRLGRVDGDSGCTDKIEAGVLGLEWLDVCSATEGPKLQENM